MDKPLVIFMAVLVLAATLVGLFLTRRQLAVPTAKNTPIKEDTTIPAGNWDGISSIGFPLLPLRESGVYGGVELKASEVGTKVTVNITTNGTGESLVADIYTGGCPTPESIKYKLSSLTNGKSETTIDAPLTGIVRELPLAVSVSAQDSPKGLACGDLLVR